MKRDYRVYLRDILQAFYDAQNFVGRMTYEKVFNRVQSTPCKSNLSKSQIYSHIQHINLLMGYSV